MANVELSTFDVEFALNQFSGNRTLLVKMLDRFCEQHAMFNEQLRTYIKNDEQALTKQDVHGLKGVSGNLGMKALHQTCREFEDLLRKQTLTNIDSSNLTTMLDKTLQQVRQFTQADKPSSQGQETTVSSTNTDEEARNNLLKALKRNEFISHTKLSAIFGDLSMPADTLQQLQIAIDELDYEKAISLLE